MESLGVSAAHGNAEAIDDAIGTAVTNVGVLDKAVVVLRAVETHGPLGLAELQGATGLPRATAHRLAAALVAHGLLRRDGAGRFALGLGLVGLGRAAADGFPLAEHARPALEVLRDETGESVQLYVREGAARRCVVSLQSPHGLRWIVPEGALLPLGIGSAGRVLDRDHDVERDVDHDVDRDVAAGPGRPWVASVEEREKGVASVSAAIVDQRGVVVGAVSVSGPVERLSRQPGALFGDATARAAATVTAALRRPPPLTPALTVAGRAAGAHTCGS